MSKVPSLLIALFMLHCMTVNAAPKTCKDQCTTASCYFNTRINECLACPNGCASCSDSNTCETCSPGYYMNAGGNCVHCGVNGCAKCSGHDVCEICMSGHFLANSSSCQYCGYLCETCASPTTCATYTNNTYYGIYFSKADNTCKYCPDGCETCDSSGTCKKCRDGFMLSGNKCLTCYSIDSACKSCDKKQTTCTECMAGYYLLDNKCLECSAGCNTCYDDTMCEECQPGHFLNSNGGCTRCISNCKICRDSLHCAECQDGYEYLPKTRECSPCKNACMQTMSYRPVMMY